MKTDIFTLIASSALVLFSCAKEKSPAPEQDAPMRFAVTVEGTTKASMTSADLTQFYLKVTGPNNAFSYFESITKDAQGNWTASQPILWKDEESAITYAAASYGALGADYFNIPVTNELFTSGATMGLLTDQSTQARLNAADLLTMKSTDLTFAASNKGLVPITLKHGLAKVNFVVSIDNAGELTAEGIKDVVVSGVHTAFSFKPLTGEVTIPLAAPKGVVVPFLSSVEAGKATLEAVLAPEPLAAGALSLYITVNGKDFQWTNSEALDLVQGGEYTVPVSIDYPAGPVTPDPGPTPDPTPLSGVFSVSAVKTVQFSKGNLRYASGAWSFFDNQYDYYSTYGADAWDKFGWSNATNNFGMSTSTVNADYQGDLVDWGTVPGIGTGWFTLSNDEWGYLFNTRSASTVNSVDNARYAKGKVNGVYGIILFPDTYTHPTGVTLPVGINEVGNTGWNGNNYSAADWTAMETAGCVFLPAAGYREGTSVQSAGSSCSYRSSTRVTTTTDMVNYVYFAEGGLTVSASNYGRYGQCVRLVKDAN